MEIFGIYDSGANISLINSRLIKFKNSRITDTKRTKLSTITGVKKTEGIVTIYKDKNI